MEELVKYEKRQALYIQLEVYDVEEPVVEQGMFGEEE